MSQWKEIKPDEITGNVFDLVGRQWMLITAGDQPGYNTMTASWGGLGVLWGSPVSFCFVRPSRYTYEFMEKADYYSLSFFDDSHRGALNFCGSHSGRDCDKAKETGLTPVFGYDTAYFEEASLVLVCQKQYALPFDPKDFLDPSILKNYANGDYHKMYVGKIVKVLTK